MPDEISAPEPTERIPPPEKKPLERKLLASVGTVVATGDVAILMQYYLQLPDHVAMAAANCMMALAGLIVGYWVRSE
jgi:putative flippase GtrA